MDFIDLKIDLKVDKNAIIIIDPEAELENLKRQGKKFAETDKSKFISPFDLRGDNNA